MGDSYKADRASWIPGVGACKLRAARARLRRDCERWPAQLAVLVEPVVSWLPVSELRWEQSGWHVAFQVRVIVVAPFPVTLVGVEGTYTPHIGRQNYSRPFSESLLERKPLLNGVDCRIDVDVTHVDWPLMDDVRIAADVRCVVPLDVTGTLVVRGPWDADAKAPASPGRDQAVKFAGTIWLPFYAPQRPAQPTED